MSLRFWATNLETPICGLNPLELVPGSPGVRPATDGQIARLNSDGPDSTVLLFLRPASGVYPKPPMSILLTGKSRIIDVEVAAKDMPNFFVEAITVADGRVYTEVRQIAVPAAVAIAECRGAAVAEIYQPGQRASITIKVTDALGKPFVGTAVVAIYGKAVDQIAGRTNVPEIKKFFWNWRRDHRPVAETNLRREFDDLLRPNETAMQDLGVFGDSVMEELGQTVTGAAAELGFPCIMFRLHERHGSRGQTVSIRARVRQTVAEIGADAVAAFSRPCDRIPQPQPYGSLRSRRTAQGEAEVSLTMPEYPATWKVKVWAMGHGTKVGQAEAEIITAKDSGPSTAAMIPRGTL